MANNIIAIDLSYTCTGLAWGHDETGIQTTSIKSNAKNGNIDRALFVAKEIMFEAINFSKPNHVYIENYAFGVSGKRSVLTMMAELCGIVQAEFLKEHGLLCNMIASTSIKKYISGKGNLKKQDMPMAVFKKWAVEFDTHDEYVAYGLWKLAHAVETCDAGKPIIMTEYQREVVRQILKAREEAK